MGEPDLGIPLEHVHHRLDVAGQKEVVAVDERDDVGPGGANAGVARRGGALVVLLEQAHARILEAPNERSVPSLEPSSTTISSSAGSDWPSHRATAACDRRGRVEGGHDDRYPWPGSFSRSDASDSLTSVQRGVRSSAPRSGLPSRRLPGKSVRGEYAGSAWPIAGLVSCNRKSRATRRDEQRLSAREVLAELEQEVRLGAVVARGSPPSRSRYARFSRTMFVDISPPPPEP